MNIGRSVFGPPPHASGLRTMFWNNLAVDTRTVGAPFQIPRVLRAAARIGTIDVRSSRLYSRREEWPRSIVLCCIMRTTFLE